MFDALTREIDADEIAAFSREDAHAAPARLPSAARPGRGATLNPANRFETHTRLADGDGWETLELQALRDMPPLRTTLTRDHSRSAISWNTSPDLGFDRAVNPYRGCEHGCVYCYARPSHAYLGYSPGLDFETKLTFKPDVAAQLERELRKPGYVAKPLALGSNTDPYQPVERTLRLTRSVLEVLERFGHPCTIVTKSAGVLLDIDVLARLAARGLVRVYLSVTTLDPRLARIMEPRAASPALRLSAIDGLSRAGVPAGVLAAPMIPGLNDAELEAILARSAAAGARHAGYVLLRLPYELREIFESWLLEHLPGRARHVLSLIRQTRAGALNDSRFGERFRGEGPYAELLSRRFARASRQLGFLGREALETRHFAVPGRSEPQLAMFE